MPVRPKQRGKHGRGTHRVDGPGVDTPNEWVNQPVVHLAAQPPANDGSHRLVVVGVKRLGCIVRSVPFEHVC
ncbi:MAG: hypothetical protein ABSH04_02015 [Acidimicrobiales bacterium]